MRTIVVEITEFQFKGYKMLMASAPASAQRMAQDYVIDATPGGEDFARGYGIYGQGCYELNGKYFAYIDVGTSCD